MGMLGMPGAETGDAGIATAQLHAAIRQKDTHGDGPKFNHSPNRPASVITRAFKASMVSWSLYSTMSAAARRR